MGAEASRLDGEKATFRYGAHSLVLWATERVDALFEEDGQFYEAEIQGEHGARTVQKEALTSRPLTGFEDGQVRVLFVEYGNEQMCAFEDLRLAQSGLWCWFFLIFPRKAHVRVPGWG